MWVRACLQYGSARLALFVYQPRANPSEEMSNGNFNSLQFFPLNFDHR